MDYLYEDKMSKLFIELYVPSEEEAPQYFDMLRRVSSYEILTYIKKMQACLPEVKSINIPQFSNIDALNGVLDIVYSSENITFEDIGYYFYPDSKINAQWKYGENHYKTAALLGLTSWDKPYHVTEFGVEYMKIPKADRAEIRNKLILRIPIIQQVLIQSTDRELKPLEILCKYLAESTAKRRHSNVHVMVDLVLDSFDGKQKIELIENIKWK